MNRRTALPYALLFAALTACGGSPSDAPLDGDASDVQSDAATATDGASAAHDGGVVVIGSPDAQATGTDGGTTATDAAKDGTSDAQGPAADGAAGDDGSSTASDGAAVDAGTGTSDGQAGCPTGDLTCSGACVPSDVHNCGACGHDCTVLAHVSGATTCTASGACLVPASSCAPGWADCDGNPDDGCETDVTGASHCGGCGNVCPADLPQCAATGGAYSCTSGCPASEPTLCGSTCADTTSDVANCGACGKACPAPAAHSHATCAASACATACNSGYAACGGACVDETSDDANCGGCGKACGAGQVCSAGTCECTAASCPNGCCSASGACVPWAQESPTSCGTGGAACGACSTDQVCSSGACVCEPGTTSCSGVCKDLATDDANCGTCGHGCSAGQVCTGGTCECTPSSCPDGCCSATGACVPWASESPASCGTGGATCGTCASGDVCSAAGACECLHTMCGSSCVDTTSDGENCGACGHSCLGGACSAGVCQPVELATTGGTYMAIDSTNAYWSDGTNFYSCPLTGGCGAGNVLYTAPSTTSYAATIAVPPPGAYGNVVFLATGDANQDDGGLLMVPRTGGAATTLLGDSAQAFSPAFDPGSARLYYALDFATGPAELYSRPVSGSGNSSVFSGVGGPVAVDSKNVYFGDATNYRVASCPLGSTVCAGTTLLTGIIPFVMVADGSSLWVGAAPRGNDAAPRVGLYKCATSGTCSSPAFWTASGDGVVGLAVDGTSAYWITAVSPWRLMTCPESGCPASGPTVLTDVAPPSSAVAVDANAVYWISGFGLYKLAK